MRIIAVFVFLVIIFFPAYGQDKNYGLSAGTQFGFIFGQSLELVYPVSGGTKGNYLSELKWDLKPVFYSGFWVDFAKVDLMSSPGFFASFSFKAGIPSASGIMEDRDWLSVENDALTNYSRHDNKTQGFFAADLSLGASIPVKPHFYIKPFLCGSWMHFSFSATNGYAIYAREKTPGSETFYRIDDNPDTETFSGEIMTYRQDWLFFAAGLQAGTKILSPFSFDISFKISPLIFCFATDQHKHESKKFTYKDFTYFGLYLEPSAGVSFIYKRTEISLNFTYRYAGKSKGKGYYKESGDSDYSLSPNAAGAGLSIFDVRFLFVAHF